MQRISSFVESYEVIARRISPRNWSDQRHFLYTLGPPLPLPEHPVKGTDMRSRHIRIAFDLLLTYKSVREAELRTKGRLAQAGAAE